MREIILKRRHMREKFETDKLEKEKRARKEILIRQA